jgi:hypothetical protein
MLFQDFFGTIIGSIIGSFIATIGSIIVWLTIEFLKKYRDKKKLRKNIRLLYKNLAKGTIQAYMAIRIANLIDEIGKKNFLKILKLILHTSGARRALISKDFTFRVMYGPGQNSIKIIYADNYSYSFESLDQDPKYLNKFLEFYKEQCKNENIKV